MVRVYVRNYSMSQKPKIIAVVGATSTGKTAFAVALAKKVNGEVVSVDSRQVYRGLNLGTGKVTKKEMGGIPHHLLDCASPARTYTASLYLRDARRAIADIAARGKTPILCGGTGFYLDMLLGRIQSPDVPPNPRLRKVLQRKSAPALFALLKRLDPKRAATIDPHNPVRLIRAIEIAKALGAVPHYSGSVPYDVLTIGLKMPRETLMLRIAARLKARLKAGMLREARRLHASGLSFRRMETLGLEYRYMARFLQKKINRTQMEQQLLAEIIRYAKRQATWFKRDASIVWLSPIDVQKALALVRKHLEQ